jgi:hypothetical protein
VRLGIAACPGGGRGGRGRDVADWAGKPGRPASEASEVPAAAVRSAASLTTTRPAASIVERGREKADIDRMPNGQHDRLTSGPDQLAPLFYRVLGEVGPVAGEQHPTDLRSLAVGAILLVAIARSPSRSVTATPGVR